MESYFAQVAEQSPEYRAWQFLATYNIDLPTVLTNLEANLANASLTQAKRVRACGPNRAGVCGACACACGCGYAQWVCAVRLRLLRPCMRMSRGMRLGFALGIIHPPLSCLSSSSATAASSAVVVVVVARRRCIR